jgi:hypothetical protein
MSTLALAGARSRRGNFAKYQPGYQQSLNVGPVSLTFITILLGFVLSLFYLTQSNKIATRGYQIAKLQSTRSELLATQDQLQVEAARLQSIEQIKASVTAQNQMVPVTSASYLNPPAKSAKSR